jgi:UDP-N-acetylglucosamine diphosphorylase / glucose-1-phosphate thymidylyltransferase / UDP-N-acetylgalactosamine diphosphorylase / glucosamine-1-phosphate N-acetyltransferase / galactosamine-1-phosphate N-acetyltransferase
MDSMFGKDVWLCRYSGTVNVLLDRKNVGDQTGERLMDAGTDPFGVVIENHCAIGASVIILLGKRNPPNTVTKAGTFVDKKEIT